MSLNLINKIQSIFHIKKLKQLNKIEGHLGLNEGSLLFGIAKSLKENSVIVEIGSFKGKSACFICEGLGSKKSQFFCIDTWCNDTMQEGRKDIFDVFLKNTKDYKDKINMLRGFSHEVINKWPKDRKIDFLWVDGDHSYQGVKKDIINWLPLVKKNSFVCFHDYRDAQGVKKAVDELVKDKKIKFVKTEGCIYASKLL